MSEQKETKANKDDLRVRLFLPEIHLNQLTTTKIGATCCNDEMNVKEFMSQNKNLAEENRINFLKQIEYILLRLHSEELSCNKLTHSQIFIMKNFFTNPTSDKSGDREKRADIQSLANLYCFILTNGEHSKYSESLTVSNLLCSCPYEALDIIKKMVNEKVTMNEVLQHPFHWNEQQKVLFLCRTVEYINAKHKQSRGEIMEILKKYNMGEVVDVLPERGWIEVLPLTKNEIKERTRTRHPMTYPATVEKGLIYDLALKPHETKAEREKLVYELLRFIRNRYIHFCEDSKDIKMCFESYPVGYLKFFSSRFPKLFMHVYNNMKTFMCLENNVEEFANQRFNNSFFNVNMHVRPVKP